MLEKAIVVAPNRGALGKCPSGIDGLDEITGGGFPAGRPTLICGGPGCGKTLLSVEFLVRGALDHGEPGVFLAFEESESELARNVRSLGFDLDALVADKKLVVDHVKVERSELEENGEYDLSGLFIRLGYAIDSIGAKRVVLDTIEMLFSGLDNQAILRAELQRLFRWLKEKGVTAVITAERGQGALTRQGLEEYVSDCVILLDHRVTEQVSTRRLRIVKYRGSVHGTNEYPFLIDEDGFSVLPITSAGLEHQASNERVSTGISRLDSMLGGAGVYRGTTVLVSGSAGTGKSSIAAHFANASCARGESCLYFAFEESSSQMIRNMRSIGIELQPWVDAGKLRVVAGRPTATGLEMHLASMHKHVRQHRPQLVIVDPISNLTEAGTLRDAGALVLRMLDFFKFEQITAVFTSLTSGGKALEATDVGISSVVDTWILLRDIELGGERNRGLYVLKSRGMAHSNQIREFLLTSHGVDLRDVYVGPEGVLTGSMRLAQEARERAVEAERRRETERGLRAQERKRRALEAQIALLRAELDEQGEAVDRATSDQRSREEREEDERSEMSRSRKADEPGGNLDQASANPGNGA
jgi:circadian clock protein KaiC